MLDLSVNVAYVRTVLLLDQEARIAELLSNAIAHPLFLLV
jgi:hypothetical protein